MLAEMMLAIGILGQYCAGGACGPVISAPAVVRTVSAPVRVTAPAVTRDVKAWARQTVHVVAPAGSNEHYGSGVIVRSAGGKSLVLTANHVVRSVDKTKIRVKHVSGWYPATYLGSAGYCDLAALAIATPPGAVNVTIAEAAPSFAWVYGYPGAGALERYYGPYYRDVIADGRIYAEPAYQFSVPFGVSGAPVVDAYGHLAGVAWATGASRPLMVSVSTANLRRFLVSEACFGFFGGGRGGGGIMSGGRLFSREQGNTIKIKNSVISDGYASQLLAQPIYAAQYGGGCYGGSYSTGQTYVVEKPQSYVYQMPQTSQQTAIPGPEGPPGPQGPAGRDGAPGPPGAAAAPADPPQIQIAVMKDGKVATDETGNPITKFYRAVPGRDPVTGREIMVYKIGLEPDTLLQSTESSPGPAPPARRPARPGM
jgi:hypothetical protein